ncbi:hypothetical protein B0T25DRAFT_10223 [Lasiosphaeria hispida]|uniref:Uncharacterized protein n=1 Tax=Lasiosphaeria hispida TaxID=260671 RepID=A0AAJ0MJC2_9PEZI|nr:hypothetical protein B0T25DRAFT_10223 [Lasiosphaeria hispida]
MLLLLLPTLVWGAITIRQLPNYCIYNASLLHFVPMPVLFGFFVPQRPRPSPGRRAVELQGLQVGSRTTVLKHKSVTSIAHTIRRNGLLDGKT